MQAVPDVMSFQQVQRQFAGHLRDPDARPSPADVEDRRMEIYRGLFYRNIEGFIQGAFPVLRAVLAEHQWHGMVRDFMANYRCQSPYFLEISREFVRYLREVRQAQPEDPPYLLELAHYEWVELALDVADVEPEWSAIQVNGDLLDGVPVLSPTAWSLAYCWPVHLIGPGWQLPSETPPATYIVVYRNREDMVKFMEINAVTARLLELLASDQPPCGRQALQQLAGEMAQQLSGSFIEAGREILGKLQAKGIVLGTELQQA